MGPPPALRELGLSVENHQQTSAGELHATLALGSGQLESRHCNERSADTVLGLLIHFSLTYFIY